MYQAKGSAPASMKTTAVQWIIGLSKNPIDWSCVENPPVDSVAIAWLIASKEVIPPAA